MRAVFSYNIYIKNNLKRLQHVAGYITVTISKYVISFVLSLSVSSRDWKFWLFIEHAVTDVIVKYHKWSKVDKEILEYKRLKIILHIMNLK